MTKRRPRVLGCKSYGWIAATTALACVVGCGSSPVVTDRSAAEGASVTSTTLLKCARLDIERGTTGLAQGQSVSSLAVRDESGAADDWTRYVNFDVETSAVCVFALPAGTSAAQVASASLLVNYRGPQKADMLWTFSVQTPATGAYAPVGDNGFAADWVWTASTMTLPSPATIFDGASGELRIRYATSDQFDNSMIDQLAVAITLGTSQADAGVDAAAVQDSGGGSSVPDASATADAPSTVSDSGAGSPLGAHLYGVTVDDISNLSDTVAALKALPKKPTTRVVFDETASASYYAGAVPAIHAVSYVMGELLDSAYMTKLSVGQYTQRTSSYLEAFPTGVDVWEVGNEINGSWLGAASDVSAKMSGAYDLVKAAGGRTELTLYGCSDSGASNDMFVWTTTNVPARMRSGLDYVLVSYYEGDCGNPRSDWPAVFDRLRQLYPNAALGFGEVGATDANGSPITDPSIAGPYLQKYYGMPIATPGYVGGYFWWYFAEQMVPRTKPMFPILSAAIAAMP